MTIAQLKKIEEHIKQREIIAEYMKDMEDVYAVDFHKPGKDDPVRFMGVTSPDFFATLSTWVFKAAREAEENCLKSKSDEITAQLKELGLEE